MRGESRHTRVIAFLLHRVEADEFDALGGGLGRVGLLQIAQPQVADVRADHQRRRAGHLDGSLHVHPAHGAACTDEQRPTARLERGAHGDVRVSAGDVVASGADVDPAVVVDAANVHVDFAAKRSVSQQRDDAKICQPRADCFDQLRIRAEQHDVVHLFHRRRGDIDTVDHLNTQRGSLLFQPAGKAGRHIAQQQAAWVKLVVEAVADGVVVSPACIAQNPRRAARLEAGAIGQSVGGSDAGPRFGQRALDVASRWLHGDQVVAVVAVEDALVDDVVARQPALDFIAIGVANVIHEDVRLDGEAVADVVLVAQVLAHTDHRHRDLVAQCDRVGVHVAVDARVLFAQLDDLDVGEAQPAGIVAHQQLVRAVGREGDVDGVAVQPEVFKASAVERPEAVALRQRFGGLAELGKFIGHWVSPGKNRGLRESRGSE